MVPTLPVRFGLTAAFLATQKIAGLPVLNGLFVFSRLPALGFSVSVLLRIPMDVLVYHCFSVY